MPGPSSSPGGTSPIPRASQHRTSAEEVLDDLVAEHEDLEQLVGSLDDRTWDAPTPATGWSIRDQIGHLAFFDEAAALALGDPERFATFAMALVESDGDPMEEHLRRGRESAPSEVLGWWRASRVNLVMCAGSTPRDVRVPWFGPAMALTSFVSARLMETWAHGQDVADALGRVRPATDRLRHVAHLGVRTRAFSYAVRGLDPPSGSVRIELEAPSGATWVWDDDEGAEPDSSVSGTALDFCLVVTQRRHVDDTSLEHVGEPAGEWLHIAQAFAGPPGPGRSARSSR